MGLLGFQDFGKRCRNIGYHYSREYHYTIIDQPLIDQRLLSLRYAHNVVGVGAFVVNDEDELLVVRERFYTRPHWKLPGGYVELSK